MIAVSVEQAKTKLSSLVQRALKGEEVVLLKGLKVVARIQAFEEDEYRLSDEQAEKYIDQIKKSKKKTFSNMEDTVAYLKKAYK